IQVLDGAKAWQDRTDAKFSTGQVTAVDVSKSDRFIATGDSKGNVFVWEYSDEDQCWRLKSRFSAITWGFAVTDLVFTADRNRLLIASSDHTVSQWDLETEEEVRDDLMLHPGPVNAMSLSKNGTQLATISSTQKRDASGTPTLVPTLFVWDLNDPQQEPRCLTIPTAESINDVLFRADNRTVLAAVAKSDANTSICQWNFESNNVTPVWRAPPSSFGALWSLLMAPSHENSSRRKPQLVTIGGKRARLWDLDSGVNERNFEPHGPISSIAFSPDESFLASTDQKVIKIWSLERHRVLQTFQFKRSDLENETLPLEIHGVVFSPKKRTPPELLVFGQKGLMQVWQIHGESRTLIRSFEDREAKNIHSAAFFLNGKHIVTGSEDGFIRLWDNDSGTILCKIRGSKESIDSIAVSPDGQRLASTTSDFKAVLWMLGGNKSSELIKIDELQGHTERLTSVAFSPDGKRIVTGSEDKTMKLWRFPDEVERRRLITNTPEPADVPVSDPLTDNSLSTQVLTLKGHRKKVVHADFFPDGDAILSASEDGKALIWSATPVPPSVRLSQMPLNVDMTPKSIDSEARISMPSHYDLRGWELTVEIVVMKSQKTNASVDQWGLTKSEEGSRYCLSLEGALGVKEGPLSLMGDSLFWQDNSIGLPVEIGRCGPNSTRTKLTILMTSEMDAIKLQTLIRQISVHLEGPGNISSEPYLRADQEKQLGIQLKLLRRTEAAEDVVCYGSRRIEAAANVSTSSEESTE
ncbi:MAG: hypothetical protein CBC13_01970, partial [Planctomycetia bacterium TMED53]